MGAKGNVMIEHGSKVLENDVIVLRELTEDDVGADYVSWMNDYSIVKYTESKFTVHSLDSIKNFVKSVNESGNNQLFGIFNDHHYITFAFVCLVAIIGMIHYLRTSHMDKIRTQMIYELLMWMNLLTIVFIILQPQHFEILLGIMIVNTSPFIGHFLALTHTRLTNLTFYALIFLILFITAYNLWIP